MSQWGLPRSALYLNHFNHKGLCVVLGSGVGIQVLQSNLCLIPNIILSLLQQRKQFLVLSRNALDNFRKDVVELEEIV